jgi:hypothetical protein
MQLSAFVGQAILPARRLSRRLLRATRESSFPEGPKAGGIQDAPQFARNSQPWEI